MAKNYMPEVAKMLGVEIGEELNLIDSDGDKVGVDPYRFTENGFFNREGINSTYNLRNLLTGEYTIQKCPWKPKDGKEYWVVYPAGKIIHTVFGGDVYDLAVLNMGNCFPTQEAAAAGKEEIMAKFEEIRKGVCL